MAAGGGNTPRANGWGFGGGGGEGFGGGGGGLATLLAQSLSLAIFGRGMLRHQRLRQHAPRLVLRQVWQTPLHFVRGVGLDLFLRSASLNLVFLVSMRLAQQLGPFQAGAHNVTMQLWLFCAHFTDALAIALRSLTATALGAKNRALAMAWGRTGLWLGLFTGLGQTVVFALLSLWVGRWFTPDIHVLAALVLPYWLFVICQPMNAVSFVLDGVLKGAGDAAFLRKWLMVGAFVGFFPPALWLTPLRHDLLGVWLGIAALMGVRTVSITARFFSGRWMDASGRVYDVT